MNHSLEASHGSMGLFATIKEVGIMSSAFVGVLVGVGFASGQEAIQFFAAFGRIGLLGCVITGIGFLLLPMMFSVMGHHLRATSHKQVVHKLMGRHLGMLFDALVTLFQFCLVVVMVAFTSMAGYFDDMGQHFGCCLNYTCCLFRFAPRYHFHQRNYPVSSSNGGIDCYLSTVKPSC